MSRGLIIFAREPVPGKVKTRLAQSIGNKAASDIYSAMLADTVNKASTLEDIQVMIFWATENDAVTDFPNLSRIDMFVQHGADLGKRMENAFETAFSCGISSCCIIGSDSPDLPIEVLSQAFHSLEAIDTDIVYGPAEDGGYYLLGMKQLWRRLFDNVQWSTPDVMEKTLERINELQLNSIRLSQWYDIDTFEDLRRIANSTGTDARLTRETVQHILTSQDTNSGM